jgi:uncharacterized protein
MSGGSGAEEARLEHRLEVVRVVLRPMGTPLPLGFLALAVATTGFGALQLGLLPDAEQEVIAYAVLLLTVPAQALASVLGFLARDPVAGTGMGLVCGSWAVIGVSALTSPPGSSSEGLGLLLVLAAAGMLVPVAASWSKLVVTVVMVCAVVRFSLTGVAEMTGSTVWEQAAGGTGLLLAVLAVYAALALQVEDVHGHQVLPLLRRGSGRLAGSDDIADQLAGVGREAGVRQQL